MSVGGAVVWVGVGDGGCGVLVGGADVGVGGGGCSVLVAAGDTWRQPKAGLDRHYGWAIAADPGRPEVWYVSAAPGPGQAHGRGNAQAHIFRSAGGAAWEKLGGGLPQPLNHMHQQPP